MKNCKEMCCMFCAKWMNRNLGLLILRVTLGVIFVAHGWQKWQVIEQVVSGFSQLNLPGWLAYVVTGIEIFGGLAMILGFATCLAGILIALVMVGAIYTVKWGGTLIPGVSGLPAYELEVILGAAALAVAFSGPGKYSLAAKTKMACGDAGCSNCKK